MSIDDFYSKTNKTERYLWEISILANYNETTLKLFDAFKYKRVFIGEYFDINKVNDNKTSYGFFVVIDSTKNNDYDFNIKALLNVLQAKTHYISNVVTDNNITIILKLTLSKLQLELFFQSKYSKIWFNSNIRKHLVLDLKNIKDYFRLPLNESSSELDKQLRYKKNYLVLKHDMAYFNYIIKPCLSPNYSDAVIEHIIANEYDEAINLEEEMYNYELINNLN